MYLRTKCSFQTIFFTKVHKCSISLDFLVRPVVADALLPGNESERDLIRMLMETCWAERPDERPSFEFILDTLESLSPLKGSQTSKRALLLQRESESLEQYISYDTQRLFQENERYAELLSRIIPPEIATTLNEGKEWRPKSYDNVTLMFFKVSNISEIIVESSPQEAIESLHSVFKALTSIITQRKFIVTEVFHGGYSYMLGM